MCRVFKILKKPLLYQLDSVLYVHSFKIVGRCSQRIVLNLIPCPKNFWPFSHCTRSLLPSGVFRLEWYIIWIIRFLR